MRSFRSISDIAWRFLVIAAAVALIVYVVIRLKIVVLPLGVALLLSTFLAPLVGWLSNRGLRRGLATAAVFLGFLAVLTGIVVLIAPPVGDQFGDLAETVSQGVTNIENWLVDGPLDLTAQQVDDYREQIVEYMRRAARSSSGQIIAGAVVVAEVLTGMILTLLATLFILKDGPKMQRWILGKVPADRREVVSACSARAWGALGGFLRGAALLGLVEGTIIAIALAIVGADLAVPVGILTFFAAFFPVLGAIVAGIVAVLVALVSGGFADAAVIAIVALVVQQFDNDLLAPVIYGRALQLHPLVVVSALTAGGSLGGIIGAFIAVPVTAMVVAVSAELWSRREDAEPLESAAEP
ncbi:MAG TPA: AI-2E family transporter [Acidimicrobiales bacterium]|jgi:putative heme transporter|nr:AI-2E family transporter [Acidimicrobiales bacterium]